MSLRALGITALGALGALGALAPPALGLGLSSPSAQPTNLQAGANSDLSIQIDVQQPNEQLRDLTIHLPPGLVGNPLATPPCTEAQLNADSCPPASDVGDVSNDVLAAGVPQTVTGELYNVVPRAGEPARFGIVLHAPIPTAPPIILQSPARLRPSDFGLDSVLTDLPTTATLAPGLPPVPIQITSITLTIAGQVGNPPKGFLRNPTSCTPKAIGFDGRAWTGATASGQAPGFTPTNCAALPFTPELAASARPEGIGAPVELTTTISQTIEEAGLARAQVILPNGITGNNSLLGTKCPRANFEAASCPANTLIGTASASSPLQAQPLTGTVYLIEPTVPGLPDIGLDLRGPLSLKLTGTLTLGTDGRAITTFPRLPDIPISDFTLTFGRQPGFVFAGVDLCESPTLSVDGAFDAFSGAATTVKAPLELQGCGPSAGGKKPKAKVKLARLGSNRPRLKLKVKAGSERLRRVQLKLPKQLKFAGGKKFKRGAKARADGDQLKRRSVKHSKRKLKLKGKRVKRFVAKVHKHALKAKKVKKNQRLRFKLKVKDERGKTTRLVVRARAQR
ncbi:MAG: hypothetical protein GEU88_17590 [Solirubrobacterales bacterium]|nr:hypothetical protein [Solirubrobacterales bacterium]